MRENSCRLWALSMCVDKGSQQTALPPHIYFIFMYILKEEKEDKINKKLREAASVGALISINKYIFLG